MDAFPPLPPAPPDPPVPPLAVLVFRFEEFPEFETLEVPPVALPPVAREVEEPLVADEFEDEFPLFINEL